jgi:hypothetical protein
MKRLTPVLAVVLGAGCPGGHRDPQEGAADQPRQTVRTRRSRSRRLTSSTTRRGRVRARRRPATCSSSRTSFCRTAGGSGATRVLRHPERLPGRGDGDGIPPQGPHRRRGRLRTNQERVAFAIRRDRLLMEWDFGRPKKPAVYGLSRPADSRRRCSSKSCAFSDCSCSSSLAGLSSSGTSPSSTNTSTRMSGDSL